MEGPAIMGYAQSFKFALVSAAIIFTHTGNAQDRSLRYFSGFGASHAFHPMELIPTGPAGVLSGSWRQDTFLLKCSSVTSWIEPGVNPSTYHEAYVSAHAITWLSRITRPRGLTDEQFNTQVRYLCPDSNRGGEQFANEVDRISRAFQVQRVEVPFQGLVVEGRTFRQQDLVQDFRFPLGVDTSSTTTACLVNWTPDGDYARLNRLFGHRDEDIFVADQICAPTLRAFTECQNDFADQAQRLFALTNRGSVTGCPVGSPCRSLCEQHKSWRSRLGVACRMNTLWDNWKEREFVNLGQADRVRAERLLTAFENRRDGNSNYIACRCGQLIDQAPGAGQWAGTPHVMSLANGQAEILDGLSCSENNAPLSRPPGGLANVQSFMSFRRILHAAGLAESRQPAAGGAATGAH